MRAPLGKIPPARKFPLEKKFPSEKKFLPVRKERPPPCILPRMILEIYTEECFWELNDMNAVEDVRDINAITDLNNLNRECKKRVSFLNVNVRAFLFVLPEQIRIEEPPV